MTISNPLLDSINILIKQLQEIAVVAEFSTPSHHLELTEKNNIFFVHLDGALLFADKDPKRSISLFYEEISRLYEDEQTQFDPSFATLREILLSRNQFVRRKLDELEQGKLSKALAFLKFDNDFSSDSLFKDINNNLKILETVNYRIASKEGIECHTCFAFSEGYCTKISMPVHEEMVCDLFRPMYKAEESEKYAEITQQPYEIYEKQEVDKGARWTASQDDELEPEDLMDKGARWRPEKNNNVYPSDQEPKPLESPENIVLPPKPNNTTFGSTSVDTRPDLFWGNKIKKAQDANLSVKTLILDTQNKLLVLKDASSDFVDLPGGHVQPGETIEEALRREVFEETNLFVTSCRQIFTKTLLLGNPPIDRPIIFFIASVMGTLVLSEEHTDAAWVSLDNLSQLNLGVFLPVIAEAFQDQIEEIISPVSSLEKIGGHEMEVTDLGQPFYNGKTRSIYSQKHHEPSAYDMGEPNPEVDNIQTTRIPSTQLKPNANKWVPRKDIPYTPEPPDKIEIKMGPRAVSIPVHKNTLESLQKVAYSEVDGPDEREKPFIKPDTDASVTSDTGFIGAFGSAARVTEGVGKQEGGAVGGSGSAGEGSGTVGSVGPLTTGDVFTPTHGGSYRAQKNRKEEFDSALSTKQQAHEIGQEGIATLPDYDVYQYDKEIREKNLPRNSKLPTEQKPLGEGSENLWLSTNENSPNTGFISNDIDYKEDYRPISTYDEAAEQYTNLSEDLTPELLRSHIRKSLDSWDTIKDKYIILSPNVFNKASAGSPLIACGYASYYVVDKEGHRVSLSGLRKALEEFMLNPEYSNMNLFHSGIQIGKVIPSFTDNTGQVWKTQVDNNGLFVIVEFRTDIEVARKAMVEVLRGNLLSFSIAGDAKEKQVICDHGSCFYEITDLTIYEISLCLHGVNQDSYITNILQNPSSDICPECFTQESMEYNSSLQPTR